MSLSTVPPILDHCQQCTIPFPPTEVFGGERRICRPHSGTKWRRRGWNDWRLKLSCIPGRGLSTLCNCGGVWDHKKRHRCTGVCTRGHQLWYCCGSRSLPFPLSHPRRRLPLLRCGCPPPPLNVPPQHWWDLFDLTLLQKRQLDPFPVTVGQDFVSSHSAVKNLPHGDLTDKERYGYGDGFKYCSSSGTGHRFCATRSSLSGGMLTAGLTQSCKETYTGWDDIVGKILLAGFWVGFYVIFTSCVTHPLRIDYARRTSQFLSKLANDNHQKNSITSLISFFSNIKHRSTRDGPNASASATGNCSANITIH